MTHGWHHLVPSEVHGAHSERCAKDRVKYGIKCWEEGPVMFDLGDRLVPVYHPRCRREFNQKYRPFVCAFEEQTGVLMIHERDVAAAPPLSRLWQESKVLPVLSPHHQVVWFALPDFPKLSVRCAQCSKVWHLKRYTQVWFSSSSGWRVGIDGLGYCSERCQNQRWASRGYREFEMLRRIYLAEDRAVKAARKDLRRRLRAHKRAKREHVKQLQWRLRVVRAVLRAQDREEAATLAREALATWSEEDRNGKPDEAGRGHDNSGIAQLADR